HSRSIGASQHRSSLDLMRVRAPLRISVAIPTPGYAGASNPARNLSKSAGVFGPHMSFVLQPPSDPANWRGLFLSEEPILDFWVGALRATGLPLTRRASPPWPESADSRPVLNDGP